MGSGSVLNVESVTKTYNTSFEIGFWANEERWKTKILSVTFFTYL